MSASELSLLTKHMGHDLNIHVDHYSLPTNLPERSKVSRVLSAVNDGHIAKLTAKKTSMKSKFRMSGCLKVS